MFWVDLVRCVLILVCAVSMGLMVIDFYEHRDDWNERTRDFWFGRLAWCVTGVSAGIEGLIRQTPFRYSLMILLVAAIVTLKANVQRGHWGGYD